MPDLEALEGIDEKPVEGEVVTQDTETGGTYK